MVFNNITLSAKATTKSFKQFDGSAFQFILHSPVYRLIGESYRPTVVEAGHLVVPSRWDDPDSIGVPEIIEDQWSMSAKSEALENSEYILHTVELISDSYASKNIEPRTSKIIYKQIIDYKNQQIISIEITNDILAYYDAMGSRTPQVTNLDVRQTLCIEDMSFKEGLDREPQTSN